jgi:predicted acylesterase/phospholipase RssA
MLPFRILVLSGGGTKGFLHIGALQELELRLGNLTTHFNKGIYGCSVGAVLATGIAFGMTTDDIYKLSKRFMNLSFVFDSLDMASLQQSLVRKGLFEMDSFETQIIGAFSEYNIDLKDKYLCDAKIPLNIIASNLTKGTPTIFRNKVPILKALRASCCIPFLFRPQLVGADMYVDGGLMTNVLTRLIPQEEHPHILSLYIIHSNPHITPANIESMSPTEFLYRLYKNTSLYEHVQFRHQNTVDLYYPGGSGLTDATENDKEEMIMNGKCLMRSFLTKYGC